MSLQQPKIVFFDIDGTLTEGATGEIPQSALKAIELLQLQGIKVVAATGRPYSMCHFLEQLGIETLITANGAYVRHEGQELYSAKVDLNLQRQVMTVAEAQQHAMTFYCEHFYYNGIETENLVYAIQDAFSMGDMPIPIPSKDVPTNLMCLIVREHEMEAYEHAFPHVTFQRWHDCIVNVLTERVSKSRAIEEVLQFYGFDASEAMAFGDGYNDVDMLEYVGFGVAMGNAPEAVKESADYVTLSAEQHGILHALQTLHVIEPSIL